MAKDVLQIALESWLDGNVLEVLQHLLTFVILYVVMGLLSLLKHVMMGQLQVAIQLALVSYQDIRAQEEQIVLRYVETV